MNRRLQKTITILCATIMAGMISCSEPAKSQKNMIKGVDDIGREISLPHYAQRIVLMTGSPTDALFAMGVGDRIIGITDSYGDSYPATVKKFPALAALPGIGSRSAPNVEAILALKPDLILVSGSGDNPEKNAAALKKAGLTYAIMKSFESAVDASYQIERLGVLCGRKVQGELIAASLRKRLKATSMLATTATVKPPKVFFWWGTGNGTYGDSTGVNELITLAGGDNIARTGGKGFFDLSPEFVVQSDPDVIIFSYWREQDRETRLAEILKRPAYKNVAAIRNRRIYAIDGHVLHASLLLPTALDSLIRWIHPELFGPVASGANSKRVVMDDCGRKVTIPADPRRIVALATADVEIFFALSAGSRLTGIPDGVKFPPAALSIERIGGMYGKFSAEKIVGRTPDLVLMTISGWGQYRKHLDLLEGHGITTLGLHYASNYDELIAQIRRIGFVTGEYNAAALLADSLERRRSAVLDKTLCLDEAERPRVYMEWISQEGGRGSTCGATDRDHEIITTAGGTNIFADRTEKSFTASDEEVISRNPQVIIITSDTTRMDVTKARAMLVSRSGWSQTEALKKNRIFVIDHQLTWANPRMIQGIEQCARIIHPELFK